MITKKQNWAHTLLGAAAAMAISCGTDAPDIGSGTGSDAAKGNSDATAEQKQTDSVEAKKPSDVYYQALLKNQLSLMSNGTSPAKSTPTIFINFDGAVVSQSASPAAAFLLCNSEADVPPSSLSDADRADVVAKVQAMFDLAQVNVNVTSNDDGLNSTTIYVGATAKDLGCADVSTLFGMVPLDIGNANPTDIGFAFVNGLKSNAHIAAIIGQVAGHAFGLSDVKEAGFVMSKELKGTETSFGSGTVTGSAKKEDSGKVLQANIAPAATRANLLALDATGTSGARPGLNAVPSQYAQLAGLDAIASLASLLLEFNTTQKLDVSRLLAQLDKVLVGGVANSKQIGGIQGVEDLLTVVLLSAEAAAKKNGATLPAGGIDALLATFLNPTSLQSSNLLSIASMAATIGISGATGGIPAAIISALGVATQTINNSQQQQQQQTTTLVNAAGALLPNFATILGIANISDFAQLVATLNAQANVIKSNYNGNTRQALLTMLRIAYSQLYTQLSATMPVPQVGP